MRLWTEKYFCFCCCFLRQLYSSDWPRTLITPTSAYLEKLHEWSLLKYINFNCHTKHVNKNKNLVLLHIKRKKSFSCKNIQILFLLPFKAKQSIIQQDVTNKQTNKTCNKTFILSWRKLNYIIKIVLHVTYAPTYVCVLS